MKIVGKTKKKLCLEGRGMEPGDVLEREGRGGREEQDEGSGWTGRLGVEAVKGEKGGGRRGWWGSISRTGQSGPARVGWGRGRREGRRPRFGVPSGGSVLVGSAVKRGRVGAEEI